MACIQCYINWAQTWAPTIILPLILWALAQLGLIAPKKTRTSTGGALVPPVYGPAYLPPFINGLVAAVRLGQDEDAFLVSLRFNYGPVVYLPWPLCQYFVTSNSAIQRVYDTPSRTLSFVPIRKMMQGSVFGSPTHVWTSLTMEKDLFPAHARALQKSKLEDPLRHFVDSTRDAVAALGTLIDAAGGELELDLAKWAMGAMFEGATSAMFGTEFHGATSRAEFHRVFLEFDVAFPLLASGMVPPALMPFVPPLAKGLRARDQLASIFERWVEGGMPGVEAGVVKDMAETSARAGWSTYEIAQILVGDCWAIQANAPFASVWALCYILQSPVLADVRKELEALKNDVTSKLDIATLSMSLPLVSSCLHETLRLATSSFSIRIVEEDYLLPVGPPDADVEDDSGEKVPESVSAPTSGYVIPAGARIICATRVPHIDERRWGPDASSFDGRRFMDREGEGTERSKRAREVRGFGGGISMCEGRHLATAELKAFLVEALTAFDFKFLHPILVDRTAPGGPTPGTTLQIVGTKGAMKPSLAEGRVGMGVHQFAPGSGVQVKVTRRTTKSD